MMILFRYPYYSTEYKPEDSIAGVKFRHLNCVPAFHDVPDIPFLCSKLETYSLSTRFIMPRFFRKPLQLLLFFIILIAGLYPFFIQANQNMHENLEEKISIAATEKKDNKKKLPEAALSVSSKIKQNISNPVAKYGQLSVNGTHVVDKNGNPVALHGMSFFHCGDADKFKNEECIKWLLKDWNCKVIRLPVMPAKYERNPKEVIRSTFEFIDACIELGIYVIVDFHGLKNPAPHQHSAIKFFSAVAERYGNLPNIIYEPYNEPYGDEVTWTGIVKPYHEAIIAAIRKYDKNNSGQNNNKKNRFNFP